MPFCRLFPRAAASALILSLVSSASWATAATIAAVSVTSNVQNFSPSGMNIGRQGYWFANFNAATPTNDAPVDQDDANALPSWLAVNFDPLNAGYSFPRDNGDGKPYAVSRAQQAGANQFVLPNGSVGGSGQLVDTRMNPSQSDTLVKDLTFGIGSPTSILFRVVLDNVGLDAGTQLSRIRATYRMPSDGNTIVRAMFDIAPGGNDGLSDVYTFRLDGIQPTGYLALQLTTTSGTTAAGMAGFTIDPVPEPATWVLALGAVLTATGWRRYRNRR